MKIEYPKQRFFSVKHTLVIEGIRFIPSVCYPLTGNLQNVILEAETKGLTRTYTEKMRFVSGVAYPVQKKEAATVSSSVSTPPKGDGGLGKKGGKPIDAEQKSGRDFE
jgi:hypothetical protein